LLKKTFKRGVDTDPPSNYNTDMTNTAYNMEKRRADRNWELYADSENKLKREREAAADLRSEIIKISRRLRAHGGAAEIAESLEIAHAASFLRWSSPRESDLSAAALVGLAQLVSQNLDK
jgi:hypothetical protein